jgi:thioredoxin-related protein
MTLRTLVLALFALSFLGACASPQDKAAKAQEKSYKADAALKEKRLKMVAEYQRCVKNKLPAEAESCDYLLKAIEAVR